ncbi:hypothetical protein ACHAQA_009929 [Verticillium albo-atrum]
MTDWNKSKVVDLRSELKRRGLSHAGLKQELVQRLDEDDDQSATASGATPDHVADIDDAIAADAPESPAPIPVAEQAPESAPVAAEEAASAAETVDAPAPVVLDEPMSSPEVAEAANPTSQPVAPETNDSDNVATPALSAPEPEVVQDSQKRKRRSTSPAPDAKRVKADGEERHEEEPILPSEQHSGAAESIQEDVAQKPSQLADDHVMEDAAAAVEPADAPDINDGAHELQQGVGARSRSPVADVDDRRASSEQRDLYSSRDAPVDAMDLERDVEPAVHPATRALYIKNFMRPLRTDFVRDHLLNLITPRGEPVNEDAIEIFYLDQIRTHAYAVFSDTSKAVRARSELHNITWPDESNRKPLWVDFVPPERVQDWILEEEPENGRRGSASARWEVRYDRDDDGNVTATLDSGSAPPPALFNAAPPTRPSRPLPPLGPSGTSFPPGPGGGNSVNAIPIGPRAGRGGREPPSGPRGPADSRGPGRALGFASGPLRTTSANPPLTFQTVSEDLARQRVDSMRSHYTRDLNRDMGAEDEINRYTFESGDVFVDRGKEVFIGIRPPHREAERQRQLAEGGPLRRPGPGPPRGPPRRGARGPGGPGGRPLSDRYLPGINESGPFRQGDRGNFSRRDDDRFGDFRRGGGRRDDWRGGGGGGGGGYRGGSRY